MQLQQLELTTVKKHMLFVQNFLRVLTMQLQLENISATDRKAGGKFLRVLTMPTLTFETFRKSHGKKHKR
jgi:hypothetical protein